MNESPFVTPFRHWPGRQDLEWLVPRDTLPFTVLLWAAAVAGDTIPFILVTNDTGFIGIEELNTTG